MKILILSPLFPPDVGEPASYVKELLQRLQGHTVEALIYGFLPESVGTVEITAIDKRTPLLQRLLSYTQMLHTLAKRSELIVINNAPSVELPMLFVSLFCKNTLVLCESDPRALAAAQSGVYKILHTLLKKRCVNIITFPKEDTSSAPERLPFSTLDTAYPDKREQWWIAHIKELTTL